MVFSSLLFLFVFFPIFMVVYFLSPKKLKNLILFISSLIFYAWGEPIYVLIMIFSTILDYTIGRVIDANRESKKIKAIALIVSVVVNLGMLGFFKYSDFLVGNLNMLIGTNFKLLNLPLPIGISFYTFQTMSYTIDLYRGKVNVQKNIISFGAYVAMFPQLIAGPIVTYATVDNELNNRVHTLNKFGEGVSRFIEGLGKKVLIANNIGILWDIIKNTSFANISIVGAWLGIIGFALQLYFDFSGYSDMAIGLGKMMGFNFPENFNHPYISKSVTEFWRRWHMTLGSWFRDYVYIPLGGNRVSKGRFYFNIFVVWFLTGFWHGAGWNFIVWGLYFAIFMIIEKSVFQKVNQKGSNTNEYIKNNILKKSVKNMLAHTYLLIVVLISWVFFSLDSFSQAIEYLKIMFGLTGQAIINSETLYLISNFWIYLIVAIIFATPIMKKVRDKSNGILTNVFYVVILILSTAYLVDSTFNPFLYFRF